MKRAIILLAILAAAGLAGAQMFAQIFGGETWTPAALNPIAWYKGENNALDSAGSANGTWVGGVKYLSGKVGQSFKFSATNLVSISNDFVITNQLTLCAWVKATNTGGSHPRIVGVEGDWIMYINTVGGIYPVGCLRFYGSGIDAGFPLSINSLFGDTWHHVVCTYSGDGVIGYVDGASVGTLELTGNLLDSESPITIGNRANKERGLDGSVDDVLIFDRALTQAEITKLYTESVKKAGAAW